MDIIQLQRIINKQNTTIKNKNSIIRYQKNKIQNLTNYINYLQSTWSVEDLANLDWTNKCEKEINEDIIDNLSKWNAYYE
jgi:uncharacterized protein YeeX (DUF496 family)